MKAKNILNFSPVLAEMQWDEIEVHPVMVINPEEDESICEICDEGKEDFWSVYLHDIEGGVVCIADVEDKTQANNLAQLIRNCAENFKPMKQKL